MLPIWVEITVDREADPMTALFRGLQIVPGVGKSGTDEGEYPLDEDTATELDTDLDTWFPENAPA